MKKLFLIFIIVLANSIYPDNSLNREIEENRIKLEDLRQEIRKLKKSIEASRLKETSILEQVALIDKELSILSKAKQLLDKKIVLLTRKVDDTRQDLHTTEIRLHKYKKEAAERMVQNYKYGKVRNLELLIKSDSFNQALIRYKYLKLFAKQESQLLQSIQEEIVRYKSLEEQLSTDLKNQKDSYNEKKQEERNYIAKRAEKESTIRAIQWDRTTKKKLLEDREKNQAELTRIITELIRQQKNQVGEPVSQFTGDPFKKRKGKLRWPVRGKIMHAYGKQKDKTLKTTVNNTGIDIRAKRDSNVKAVYHGRVSLVTYLPGYGNTIIIDHGDGYYSVYAHLDEIRVEEGRPVNEGDIIGSVGDSGSLEGYKLHFEIYANNLTVNPQHWLEKI